jgi:hypothetical protein
MSVAPPKPAQRTAGLSGPRSFAVNLAPSVAPSAAMSTRPSRPIPRSINTTVVASVRDPAAGAVSAMRITSPPMLLGRKLLKNVATRNDELKRENGKCTPCASSSSPQRHALTAIIT